MKQILVHGYSSLAIAEEEINMILKKIKHNVIDIKFDSAIDANGNPHFSFVIIIEKEYECMEEGD
jgi:hypothetical protein